jgi:GTP-binding protein
VEDYRVIREELAQYSEEFLNKPILILANKMDVPEARENLVKFKNEIHEEVIEISAATGSGLGELSAKLFKFVAPLREDAK